MRKGKPVTRFHVMAKPVGPVCNLDCSYCFYAHKQDLLKTANRWHMTDEVLEEFIRQYIERQNCDEIVFSWQGGEPTLRGLDFFHKVIALQQQYANGKRIVNDLQTNGTLLDDEWCRFLARHGFLVGLSIDGPKKLHDRFRIDTGGRGSFDEVMRAATLLKKHRVKFNTLTCIHRENARRPYDVYRFLTRELGATRLQFIPIVETKDFVSIAPQHWAAESLPVQDTPAAQPGHPESVVHDWSVNPEDWGYFLTKVFDDWYRRDVGKVWIYLFESALKQWLEGASDICTFAPVCGQALAIEHDGSLFSCDHYVYPEYRLGNIMETPIDQMAMGTRQQLFRLKKETLLPQQCRDCSFLEYCNGGCPKDRCIRTPDGEPGLNYLCTGWKQYFDHILPHLDELSKPLRR